MLKRPNNTETMDEILEMQRKYLEKKDNKKFEPAAQVVTKNKAEKSSLFAKQRNIEKKKTDNSNKVTVINDVIERKYNSQDPQISSEQMDTDDSAFPEVMSIDIEETVESKESIFASMMKKSTATDDKNENIDDMKKSIDEENMERLKSMSAEEILKEREELLKALDPSLVKFLMDKRKGDKMSESEQPKTEIHTQKEEKDVRGYINNLPAQEILEDASAFNYVNMNIVEPEKLEWLRDVEKIQSIPKDKKYEARFDLKGFLLPYTFEAEEEAQKDNRELFCHEEETHRPGYTLQELFRLARAEMLQQRVSSISAISGILNMYMQGFYDGIIDLPVSKIFFFLRFGLDENIPAIIEVCSKSLACLFYNEADEALLDMIFETNHGFMQPALNNENIKFIEDSMEQLAINENLFESKIADDIVSSDDREKESMTDFHLAETNLTECLERTNIIERISYIMTVMLSNQNTNISCLKILIRLARHSETFSEKIMRKRNLMDFLLSDKILKSEKPEESQMVIKLCRILASYGRNNLFKLLESNLLDKLMSFVSSQGDMNVQHIKLQIEAFRFLRLYFRTRQDEGSFGIILYPLRYLLEWHLQHLEFNTRNHYICRIHASALIFLIQCSNMNVAYPLFGETFKMCCKKWYQRATVEAVNDLSQKILLSSVLDVAGTFIKFIPEFYYDFITDYLVKFLESSAYKKVTESLKGTSLLLSDFLDRRFIHKPLGNLGSIVRRNRSSQQIPRLIYSQDYSAYYINSLISFVSLFQNDNRNDMNVKFYEKLKQLIYRQEIEKFLEKFSLLTKRLSISSNWFAQIELKLLYNLLKMSQSNHPWRFKVAYNLIRNLNTDKFLLVLDIFDQFIFNAEFSTGILTEEDLERMKYAYNGLVMSKIKTKTQAYSAMTEGWSEALLNDTWPYEFLLIFLHNIGINSNDERNIVETDLKEEEIITTTLKLKCFLSSKDIHTLSIDEQLMYLMLIYFGKDLSFLNESIKVMLKMELETLKGKTFNFNIKLNDEKDFESLYKLFLDTFQAQSYADSLFSSFVMIPLMQKYDVKWRNIVWSEYAMVLKFITCTEQELLYDFNDYLYPVETNELLLKAYQSSLKYLQKDSLPWKIAVHHLNHSKS